MKQLMTWKSARKGHEDVVGATLFLTMFPWTQGAGESASMTILVKMGNDSEITLSGFFSSDTFIGKRLLCKY